MVMDLFNTILKDLENYIPVKDLQADKNASCLIQFEDGSSIQLELDGTGDFLCVGTSLGSVPAGRYRQTLFKEALRANGLPPPRHGTFAFSEKNNSLIFYEYLWAKEMNGEKLSAFLLNFRQKANLWREAIVRGSLPDLNLMSPKGVRPKGMFGL